MARRGFTLVLVILSGYKVRGPCVILLGTLSALVVNLSLLSVAGAAGVGMCWGFEDELKSQFLALFMSRAA